MSAGDDFLLLRGGFEAADGLDDERVVGHAFAEGVVVLLGEDGGGHEDGDLIAVLDGFEGGAHGDFGFAVADVAAEEAVHRPGRVHVLLDFARRRGLVFGGFG